MEKFQYPIRFLFTTNSQDKRDRGRLDTFTHGNIGLTFLGKVHTDEFHVPVQTGSSLAVGFRLQVTFMDKKGDNELKIQSSTDYRRLFLSDDCMSWIADKDESKENKKFEFVTCTVDPKTKLVTEERKLLSGSHKELGSLHKLETGFYFQGKTECLIYRKDEETQELQLEHQMKITTSSRHHHWDQERLADLSYPYFLISLPSPQYPKGSYLFVKHKIKPDGFRDDEWQAVSTTIQLFSEGKFSKDIVIEGIALSSHHHLGNYEYLFAGKGRFVIFNLLTFDYKILDVKINKLSSPIRTEVIGNTVIHYSRNCYYVFDLDTLEPKWAAFPSPRSIGMSNIPLIVLKPSKEDTEKLSKHLIFLKQLPKVLVEEMIQFI